MKKIIALLILLIAFYNTLFSQSKPIIYFCEKYSHGKEIGISDKFTAGDLTLILRSDKAFMFDTLYVQADKYNPKTKKFEYYKKLKYKVNRNEKYAHFSHDFNLLEPGIIRVYVMDWLYNVIASNLVEIVE